MIEWDEPHYTKEEEAWDYFVQENQDAIGDEIEVEMIEEGKEPQGADYEEWEDRIRERLEDEWNQRIYEKQDAEADRYMTYRFGYDY